MAPEMMRDALLRVPDETLLLQRYAEVQAHLKHLEREYLTDARALREALDTRECLYRESVNILQAQRQALRVQMQDAARAHQGDMHE